MKEVAVVIFGILMFTTAVLTIWACVAAPETMNIVMFIVVVSWVLGGCK